MAEINADGDKIINCGDNILNLCDQYLAQINDLFDSLEKINKTAWSGDSANNYVRRLKMDRSSFVNFGDYLKMYGSVVRNVGVNVNTASPSLLKYVSGLTKKTIDKIISYREEKGKILSRLEIKKAKLLGDKTYEQAIGFLRIAEGDNVLDQTSIHPESYEITLSLLEMINSSLSQIGSEELINKLDLINIDDYALKLNTDHYTLEDVINSLKRPNRDPRDEMPQPILKSDILELEDLKVGMKLQGTVRNVVNFGAFIDIGLHNDGLVHISKMSTEFIKSPMDVVSVGDIVDCYVDEIFLDKKKVALSLIEPN